MSSRPCWMRRRSCPAHRRRNTISNLGSLWPPGLTVEGLRLKQANDYTRKVRPRWQWLLPTFVELAGRSASNTEAMDSHIWEVWVENSWKFRIGIWVPPRCGRCCCAARPWRAGPWCGCRTASPRTRACTPIYSRNTDPTWSSLRRPAEAGPLSFTRSSRKESQRWRHCRLDHPSSYAIPGRRWTTPPAGPSCKRMSCLRLRLAYRARPRGRHPSYEILFVRPGSCPRTSSSSCMASTRSAS